MTRLVDDVAVGGREGGRRSRSRRRIAGIDDDDDGVVDRGPGDQNGRRGHVEDMTITNDRRKHPRGRGVGLGRSSLTCLASSPRAIMTRTTTTNAMGFTTMRRPNRKMPHDLE